MSLKASLVANSSKQVRRVDYDETSSPVAMIISIRIILASTVFHDYEIWQIDAKNAFLNSNLEKDVYMVQPLSFTCSK
ncbi:hypothetical protein LIER_23168 [Lithospermum erythrorhizon]|uniref:Reverse transcriptase Ty1/copia-type domain-containing protein n=1 Tax=Lithospermum erythrorhizon TaxID=34254 RepID=A0AAV3QZW1_LITER